MFKRFFQKFALYARLPEMRLFWFFLPFLVILAGINFVPMPKSSQIFISLGIFSVLAVIILLNNLRLAASNLEIKVERNELKSIILNLQDGVIAYDPNFKILIFNRAAEQIFNVKEREVMGQYLTPERAKEARFNLLVQVIFPSLAPVVIRRSEPGIFPQIADLSFENFRVELRVTTDKIIDPNGQLLGFMKLIHDRTREVELVRSKTEFISIAAHQLRTPLTGLHWSLETLLKEPLNEEQKEIVNAGLGAAVKLSKTVNDLMDVSKIEEGRFGYQFENTDIISFIEGVLSEMQEASRQSGIKIYFKKPAEVSIVISIDQQKLRMAMLSLLDNAIRYNVSNGEVVIGVERLKEQPYIEISIKDTGVGIPSEAMQKLFTKFFRAENIVKLVPEGTGLALYIVKNIIKRHGGEVRVESELNRGSTFYFTLPTDPKLIPPKEIVYEEE